MKYGIVVDTNLVRSEGENIVMDKIFNNVITDMQEFLKENKANNVKVFIPEIVLQEVISQRVSKIDKIVKSISYGFDSLSTFNVEQPSDSFKIKNYKEILEKVSGTFLEKNKINIIKPNESILKDVTERALTHQKPFRAEGDKGFKDTLMWLSTIEFFSKEKDYTCLLLSSNSSDFGEDLVDEFVEKTDNKIVFLNSLQGLKEFLDRELPLGLHLKKLREEIINEIKSKSGDIILHINKSLSSSNDTLYFKPFSDTIELASPPFHIYEPAQHVVTDHVLWNNSLNNFVYPDNLSLAQEEKEVVAYNLSSLSIDDIKNIADKTFQVNLTVLVVEKYKDTTSVFRSFSGPKIVSFDVDLTYKRDTGEIEITSCKKSPWS